MKNQAIKQSEMQQLQQIKAHFFGNIASRSNIFSQLLINPLKWWKLGSYSYRIKCMELNLHHTYYTCSSNKSNIFFLAFSLGW